MQFRILDIQARMEKLTKKTENYKTIGILDKTTAHPFDIGSLGDLDDTQASAMSLYVQDTEQKLEVLDDLANRTRHLLDSVNGKFRHKKIRIDREEGLVAQGEKDQNLPLHSLSSGEQHELVLHYDLLFKTLPDTVVLIDEPEISLHVAWQKKFLPDLGEIVRISGFDAVVATHSPYIVGDRDDLMVGLGDPVWTARSAMPKGSKTPGTLAAEIKMGRASHKGAFLIVESNDDIRFWTPTSRRHANCELVDGEGKQNVIGGIQRIDAACFSGVLGIVDSDYDTLNGIGIESRNPLATDAHDLECLLCRPGLPLRDTARKGGHGDDETALLGRLDQHPVLVDLLVA